MKPQDMQAWRKRMGWTQEQAGARLGVNRGTVNRYENGKRAIPDMARALCQALGALAEQRHWPIRHEANHRFSAATFRCLDCDASSLAPLKPCPATSGG